MKMREIAQKAGVSPATVTRYFSGSAVLSLTSSEKIRRVIQQESDSPPNVVRSRMRKEKTIAVLIPEPKYLYHTALLNEIVTQSEDNNIVFFPEKNTELIYTTAKKLKISDLIVFEEIKDENLFFLFENIVMCGGISVHPKMKMVKVDDVRASYDGMKYLLALGHKNFLLLSEQANALDVGYQRREGALRAIEEEMENKNPPHVHIKYGAVTYDMGYQLTAEACAEKIEFSAVFAFSDEMAMGAMEALRDAGKNIPKEISVMGFDGIPEAKRTRPALCTIRQPIIDIVRTSINLAKENGQFNAVSSINLPHELHVGKSCADKNN